MTKLTETLNILANLKYYSNTHFLSDLEILTNKQKVYYKSQDDVTNMQIFKLEVSQRKILDPVLYVLYKHNFQNSQIIH